MIFSYEGFSVEITKEDWQYLVGLGVESIKKITKPIKERIPRTYTIGLRLSESGFVYQRGKIKISVKDLSEVFNNLERSIVASYLLRFRRPYLNELFDQKNIKASTPEKTETEPEDDMCSIYITI